MKTTLISLSFILLNTICWTQEKVYTKMVGMNATSFVKSFLSFNEQSPTGTPYQFTFRKISENGKAFRSKIGLNFSNTTNEEQGEDDKTTLTFVNIELALGYEKRLQLDKRWLMYGGFDVLLGINQTILKNTDGVDQFTSQSQEITGGLAPLAGLQFNITDRLSLSTEAALPLTFQMLTDKFDSGSNSSKEMTNSIQLTASLPTFVYLNFAF